MTFSHKCVTGLISTTGQIGNEAIKAVVEYLPGQYSKQVLNSKPAKATYIQTLISNKQYPFIWEYFQPSNIPVSSAKIYYDVSKIFMPTFCWSHPSFIGNVVDNSNQSLC